MVSFQDSINLVNETLRQQDYKYATSAHEGSDTVDHGKILRDYDDMMREHERRMDGHRRHVKRHGEQSSSSKQKESSSMRFRFKSDSGKSSSHRHGHRSKRHRSRDHCEVGERSERRRHRTRTRSPERSQGIKETEEEQQKEGKDHGISAYSAHPFARPVQSEYLDPADSASLSPQPSEPPPKPPPAETTFEGPDDAFRASLIDAIADDEGAAYWEGVYGEPIHVYTRPTVQTDNGLEQMTDDQYAEYVKRKMWEKKNPELVKEREDRARRELEEEEEDRRHRKTRSESAESDYEWVGNEEKGYERRRIRGKPRPRGEQSRREKKTPTNFMNDIDAALARGAKRKQAKKWQQAWSTYQEKWQNLKTDDTAIAIPWPVISGNMQTVSRENIKDFFLNCTTLREGETRMGLLKAERFRWHPDKIQHRFGGDNVDTDTLALVTSVFQTIDELMAQEKEKEGRR